MKQLSLEIPAGGEVASSQQANDVPRRVTRHAPSAERQLALVGFGQPEEPRARSEPESPKTRLPVLDDRPTTEPECQERKTWLPFCPHVGCQYHLLVDVVNERGGIKLSYITEDGEFDLEKIPKIIEVVDPHEVFDPEDMPPLEPGQTTVNLVVPATCALRVARIHDARQKSNKKRDVIEYLALGAYMALSKERVRQIAQEAYDKGRRELIGQDSTMSPTELFSEH